MSQENVEIVRRLAEAWNTDDLDDFLAELDPEVEWHPSIEPAWLAAGRPDPTSGGWGGMRPHRWGYDGRCHRA